MCSGKQHLALPEFVGSSALVSSNNFHRTDSLVANSHVLLKRNCKSLLNLFFPEFNHG